MSKTILCVDDDGQIRELIQTFLETKGYKVVTSPDGWAALRDIVVKKPDLILMDINMPKLDGLNTLDMIRVTKLTHHVPIILVSGEGDRETIMKAAKLGADDFLVKPFSFEELGARVAAQLFTLDAPKLAAMLSGMDGIGARKEALPPMLSTDARYAGHDCYPTVQGDLEMLVILPADLPLTEAAKQPADKLAKSVQVLIKTKNQFKVVWPVAAPAKKAA